MMIAALILTLHVAATPSLQDLYKAARTYDKDHFRFEAPEAGSLRRTRALVARVVRSLAPGQPPPPLVAAARAAGLVLEVARDAAGLVWVLREPDDRRAGDGFYAFRPGGSALCLQAPHTFFDEGTGDIGLALFAKLSAGALFVNTVHRYGKADGADHPADVAHNDATHFAAANQGLLDAVRWDIVQVHGFGDKQGLPPAVAAIVADGTRVAGAPAARLRAAFGKHLGRGEVRLYGHDADVLGATTNVEGKVARAAGAVFLHVEMSAATRRALVDDATPLAAALGEALGKRTGR